MQLRHNQGTRVAFRRAPSPPPGPPPPRQVGALPDAIRPPPGRSRPHQGRGWGRAALEVRPGGDGEHTQWQCSPCGERRPLLFHGAARGRSRREERPIPPNASDGAACAFREPKRPGADAVTERNPSLSQEATAGPIAFRAPYASCRMATALERICELSPRTE